MNFYENMRGGSMRRLRHVPILLTLLSGCANIPQVETREILLASPPDNWKQSYQLNNVTSRITEFIPGSEADTNWTSKLSFESFSDLKDMDPLSALQAEGLQDKERCSYAQHFNLFSGMENNYPTSVRLFLCGANKVTHRGEVKILKAIQGNDYFYFIKITKKIKPFNTNQPVINEQEIADWSNYLKGVSLCDKSNSKHPCPIEDTATSSP